MSRKERIPSPDSIVVRAARHPLAMAMISGLLLWACFRPLGWWPLALLAPVGWLLLISAPRMSGKWPYTMIYLGGLVYWLMTLQFLRLPHPAGYAGWFALSLYLAFYMPVFVLLGRIAVHRMKIPLAIAAPVIWVGLELVRGHLITGFSMVLLGHALLPMPLLVQTADLAGAYLVSFAVMMLVALGVTIYRTDSMRVRAICAVAAVVIVAAQIGYGNWRVNAYQGAAAGVSIDDTAFKGTGLKVILIQGSMDTTFENPAKLTKDTFEQYRLLTREARQATPDADLVAWPESAFLPEDLLWDDAPARPDSDPPPGDHVVFLAHQAKGAFDPDDFEKQYMSTDVAMLVGAQTVRVDSTTRQLRDVYNSAILIGENNAVADRYFKNHRVLFGEYIPFAEIYPDIYKLSPMGLGLTAGTEPRSFSLRGVRLSPSVCFESTVPHLILGQVTELQRKGEAPDVLVNLTNDGWFYGSAVLDYHLACNQFRAIEHRLPVLVAANTGFSAVIAPSGELLSVGPRRETGWLTATVAPSAGETTIYQRIGDIPVLFCLAFCLFCLLTEVWMRFRQRGSQKPV